MNEELRKSLANVEAIAKGAPIGNRNAAKDYKPMGNLTANEKSAIIDKNMISTYQDDYIRANKRYKVLREAGNLNDASAALGRKIASQSVLETMKNNSLSATQKMEKLITGLKNSQMLYRTIESEGGKNQHAAEASTYRGAIENYYDGHAHFSNGEQAKRMYELKNILVKNKLIEGWMLETVYG